MKKYMPLFEEYTGKHLLIVDVQKPFSKWWVKNGKPNFVEDLIEYCKQFDYVYEIWDSHKADSPDYDFPNKAINIEKLYGETLNEEDVRELFAKDAQPEMMDRLSRNDFERGEHPLLNGASIFYVGGRHRKRENLGHDWFYATPELLELFDHLKSLNTEVVLVGGADHECLYDIETCLELRGIPYVKNQEFIYHA